MQRPEHVVVVAGGLSFEREISLKSGHLVADALHDTGLDVVAADVDGSLLETLAMLGAGTVAFIALHGPVGEDGALRDILDASCVPYVGSRGDAARLAFDKPTAKYIARHQGIATPDYAAVTEQTFHDLDAEAVLNRLSEYLSYPLVVKPTRGGSAFGLSVVDSRDGLPQAMIRCFDHGSTALLEAHVDGTEVAVGIVEGPEGPRVLPPVEIVPLRGTYDFEARYNPGLTDYYVPARISQHALAEVSSAAMTMHRALGLRHISRSDFIVDRANCPQFLEITASPGLTETSVIIMAMRSIGLPPSSAFLDLVNVALDWQKAETRNAKGRSLVVLPRRRVTLNSESRMVRISTARGMFRLNLTGDPAALQAVESALKQLAETAVGPDDFLERASPLLTRHNIIVADIFGVGPKAPRLSVVDRVRMIMNGRSRADVETCYAQLLATFQAADPDQIDSLLGSPEDLTLVAEYTNDILANLDENRVRAADQMRRALSPVAAYLILGPDGE